MHLESARVKTPLSSAAVSVLPTPYYEVRCSGAHPSRPGGICGRYLGSFRVADGFLPPCPTCKTRNRVVVEGEPARDSTPVGV